MLCVVSMSILGKPKKEMSKACWTLTRNRVWKWSQLSLLQMTQFGLHRVCYRKSLATTCHTDRNGKKLVNDINWKICEMKRQRIFSLRNREIKIQQTNSVWQYVVSVCCWMCRLHWQCLQWENIVKVWRLTSTPAMILRYLVKVTAIDRHTVDPVTHTSQLLQTTESHHSLTLRTPPTSHQRLEATRHRATFDWRWLLEHLVFIATVLNGSVELTCLLLNNWHWELSVHQVHGVSKICQLWWSVLRGAWIKSAEKRFHVSFFSHSRGKLKWTHKDTILHHFPKCADCVW